MEFDIAQGDDLADAYRNKDQSGMQGEIAREVLAEQPQLSDYEMRFFRIFRKLSTNRQLGMAAGPIPLLAIHAYCERYNYSPMRADILERVILNMDDAYMAAYAEREKHRTAK